MKKPCSATLAALLSLCAVLGAPSAWGVEIDDITGYYTPLKDANTLLNERMNLVLRNAAEASKSCSITALVKSTKEHFRPRGLISKIFGGGIEEWMLENKQIERYKPDLDTGIYKNTPFSRSTLIVSGKIMRLTTVYPSVRLNGNLIGVDKMSHFIETGLELYEELLDPASIKKYGLDSQLNALLYRAVDLEENHLGWTMTGIKSYGDIHAHYQGALFWADYFNPEKGWIACNENRFQVKKIFDIGNYVQPGWSEAIQCNEYATSDQTYLGKFFNSDPEISFQQEVDLNIAELEKKHKKRFQCPISKKSCQKSLEFLKQNYPFLSAANLQKLNSPHCH